MKEDLFFDMEKLKDLQDLPKLNYTWDVVVDGRSRMEGIVVRLMADKRFGFIKGDDKIDYFFHQQDLNGFFDDLVNDFVQGRQIRVTFEVTSTAKGARAANVSRLDSGV